MIILDQWSIRPDAGEIVEWRPTEIAKLAGAATTAREGAVPTLLQTLHLQATRAHLDAGGRHSSYIGSVGELPRHLDLDAMSRAIHSFCTRHEALRTSYRIVDGQIEIHVLDAEHVEVEPVTVGTVDDYGRVEIWGETPDDKWTGDVRQYIEHRMSSQTQPFSWPIPMFIAVQREGSFTMIFAADHAVSDGVSQSLALDELFDHYRHHATGAELGPITSLPMGSFLEYAANELSPERAAELDESLVDHAVELFIDNGHSMPTFGLDLGLAPGEMAPMAGVKYAVLDAARTEELDQVCRAVGSRILPGLFAAVAITDYELGGNEKYFGMTIRNTRRPEQVVAQGWFCRYAPVAFPVAGASTFQEVLAASTEAYNWGKKLSDAPLETVVGKVLATGQADPARLLTAPQMLSFLDFRWFPGVGNEGYDRSQIFSGDGWTSNATIWFNRDFHYLYLDSQVPDTPAARRVLTRWHEHLVRVLKTVAATGDYTIGAAGSPERVLEFQNDDSIVIGSVIDPLRGTDDPFVAHLIAKVDQAGSVIEHDADVVA